MKKWFINMKLSSLEHMIFDIIYIALLINHFYFVNIITKAGPRLVLIICTSRLITEIMARIARKI